MIDPNQGASEEVLRRLKEASRERFEIQLIQAIESLMEDFEMTWRDLNDYLGWFANDAELRQYVGEFPLTIVEINDIAHVFSTEPYIIFKPRMPYTGS